MTTRYETGDIVYFGSYRAEVLAVENRKSDSPNYVLDLLDEDDHPPEEYNPDGSKITASNLEKISKTEVEGYSSFSEAEQDLEKEFELFEETGNPFFWEAEVVGDDGSKAVINVDFSTDWDDDFRGVANVIAFKDEQASSIDTSVEGIKESDAVLSAENLVKRAAGELSFYKNKAVKPRIHAEYEDRGNNVTGFIDIQWRPMSEVSR
jgi:hypothetical protein